MSAYGKSQPPQVHGYEAGRSFPEGTFAYPAPLYSQNSTNPPTTTSTFQNANQMPQMSYNQSQSRATYDDQTGPYLNVGSSPIPEVKHFKPHTGTQGTQIIVYITTLYELLTSSSPSVSLLFGQRKVPATLNRIDQQGAVCQYSVVAEVPQIPATGWSNSSQVPISMIMEAGDGDVVSKVDVGEFMYFDAASLTNTTQTMENPRKRKMSSDSDLMRSPAKRTIGQQLRPKEEFSPAYGFSGNDGTSNYASYMQPNQSLQPSQAYNNMGQYTRSMPGYQPQGSRNIGYGYQSSAPSTAQNIKAQSHSPQVANWGSSYPVAGPNLARNPGVPSNVGSHRPTLSSLPSPSISANPPLIRTSTLGQTPSPATTPHGGLPGSQYNAYSLYPKKAKLEINGDLEALAHGWSEEEWESKRRIVQFHRSQSGSTITTTFNPINADARPPHSICISCIYWEEKQDCFVTSVDTIYLLEQLVSARFTVEEKNRIRRNLEGFRPLTVSKAKEDSEEFFKVIMAFPAPKPRHIEKDVKVFHWKDLGSALKKIMGKYSASPSSTLPPAPPLPTPVSSNGYVTDGSIAGLSYAGDQHATVSPRSITGSTTSTAYNQNIPPRNISPQDQKNMAVLQSGASDLRVPISQHLHEAPGQWQGGQHHMQRPQQYGQLGSQSARTSWDMSPYFENPQVQVATTRMPVPSQNPGQNQNLNYQSARGGEPAADAADPSSESRMARSLSA